MTQIQVRRGTSTAWADANPVLAQGEIGYEVDSFNLKVGDGSSHWNDLSYFPVQWSALNDRPAVIASGATKAEARDSIDAAMLVNGKVPVSQLPSSLMQYQGVWDASTNTPTLIDGTGDPGDVYRVTTGGSCNLGSGSIDFVTGDYVIYNPSGVWEKSDTTDAVSSVAGRVGDVNLTVADIYGDTTTALGVGSLEVGHASDTTITRASAGQIAVEGVNIPTVSSTSTLTNKRIPLRIGTIASTATPTIDVDQYDQYNITALATAITSVTITGTPTDGQKLMVRIRDDGTSRSITWGTSFVGIGVNDLPTGTAASKTHLIGFVYDAVNAKWACIAADNVGY